ncbi:MAG: gas vesicle protein [Desulfobaccales bacterium]
MGLLLICPHCRDRVPLSASSCPVCRADLRVLPPEDRRYIFGEPEEADAAPAPLTAELIEEFPESLPVSAALSDHREVSLCEALDRILTKGAVLYGEVMLSVADVDLVYLGLQVILSSVETARGLQPGLATVGQSAANLFEKGTQ